MLSDQESEIARVKTEFETYSRQPRFTANSTPGFWRSVVRWAEDAELTQPAYGLQSARERGEWLRAFWQREPHLSGVVNAVVNIDKNRGWTLVGGRNTVSIYAGILHHADGTGWRRYCQKAALAYYTNDLGAVTELGREEQGGPLRGIYNVDPNRCRLTGQIATPLEYRSGATGPFLLAPEDFFRVVSLESTDEAMFGLGFCAVSRVVELTILMLAIYRYSLEQLGARMPKGLLILSGIDEYQWKTAMEARSDQLTAKERQFFGGVEVLGNASASADAKLIALSQLPDGFDLQTYTDLLIDGIANSFGYDSREFRPVSSGALGTGAETETQHKKSTQKGAADFVLQLQEALNQPWVLPRTVHFEFEERDDAGRLTAAQVAQAESAAVISLYNAGLQQGAPLLSRDEARELLAESGLIPPEWTVAEEEAVADADQQERTWRERLLEAPRVQRQLREFPREPVLAYRWTPEKQRWVELWRPAVIGRGLEVQRAGQPIPRPDEAKIRILLDGVLSDFMTEAETALRAGQEPDTNHLNAALLAALLVGLTNVAAETMTSAGAEVGIDIDPAEIAQLAGQWARQYSYELVSGLTGTTRDLLQQVIAQYQTNPGMTAEELRALLEPAFGALRADMIAVTETTRAYSAGVALYQQYLLAHYGLAATLRWFTQRDERVCPLCGPLDNKPFSAWGADHPDGPPAHPRCRCWLAMELTK